MTDTYPTLFSPIELGGVRLRNRIIHASIVTKYVSQGLPTEKLLNYYRSRAAGGAAAIITEPLAMTAHNRIPSRLRVWDCLLYTSPSPRDRTRSRMPSSA